MLREAPKWYHFEGLDTGWRAFNDGDVWLLEEARREGTDRVYLDDGFRCVDVARMCVTGGNGAPEAPVKRIMTWNGGPSGVTFQVASSAMLGPQLQSRLELSTQGVFPPSLFASLEESGVEKPWYFQLHVDGRPETRLFMTPMQFTAPESCCILPELCMRFLNVQHGDPIVFRCAQLRGGSYVQLRAETDNMDTIVNIRKRLDTVFSRSILTLTPGQLIDVATTRNLVTNGQREHEAYLLRVMRMEPDDCGMCLRNTELTVDIQPYDGGSGSASGNGLRVGDRCEGRLDAAHVARSYAVHADAGSRLRLRLETGGVDVDLFVSTTERNPRLAACDAYDATYGPSSLCVQLASDVCCLYVSVSMKWSVTEEEGDGEEGEGSTGSGVVPFVLHVEADATAGVGDVRDGRQDSSTDDRDGGGDGDDDTIGYRIGVSSRGHDAGSRGGGSPVPSPVSNRLHGSPSTPTTSSVATASSTNTAASVEADSDLCHNCGRRVARANMVVHSLACARLVHTCDVCGQQMASREQARHVHCMQCWSDRAITNVNTFSGGAPALRKHERMHHQRLECQCGYAWPLDEMAAHVRWACPNRMTLCRYCEGPLPAQDREAHEKSCKSVTSQCGLCGIILANEQMEDHKLQQHGIPISILPDQPQTQDEMRQQVRAMHELNQMLRDQQLGESTEARRARLLRRIMNRRERREALHREREQTALDFQASHGPACPSPSSASDSSDLHRLAEIMGHGVPESSLRYALELHNGNLESATLWLCSEDFTDGAPEPVAPTAPPADPCASSPSSSPPPRTSPQPPRSRPPATKKSPSIWLLHVTAVFTHGERDETLCHVTLLSTATAAQLRQAIASELDVHPAESVCICFDHDPSSVTNGGNGHRVLGQSLESLGMRSGSHVRAMVLPPRQQQPQQRTLSEPARTGMSLEQRLRAASVATKGWTLWAGHRGQRFAVQCRGSESTMALRLKIGGTLCDRHCIIRPEISQLEVRHAGRVLPVSASTTLASCGLQSGSEVVVDFPFDGHDEAFADAFGGDHDDEVLHGDDVDVIHCACGAVLTYAMFANHDCGNE